MSSRSRRLGVGLATAVLVGLVGLPAGSIMAAPGAPAPTSAQLAPAAMATPTPVRISGLYDFNADGHTGWILLRHDPARDAVTARLHLDGRDEPEHLRVTYYEQLRMLRLSYTLTGYRHDVRLWLAHQAGDKPSFGGYGEQRSRRESSAARDTVVYRYGVHARYISDDLV